MFLYSNDGLNSKAFEDIMLNAPEMIKNCIFGNLTVVRGSLVKEFLYEHSHNFIRPKSSVCGLHFLLLSY